MKVYYRTETGGLDSCELPVVNGFGKFAHEPRVVAVLFNFWKNSGGDDDTGTHAIFRGPFEPDDVHELDRALPFVAAGARITREERLFLLSCAGVIVGELSDGFIVSRLFGARPADVELLEKEWDAIHRYVEEDDDERTEH